MFEPSHKPRIINGDTLSRRIPVFAVAVTAAVGLTGVMTPLTAHAYSTRSQIDGNVRSFQALDGQHAFVLGSDGRLWAENGPWGSVPPSRSLVETGVKSFRGLSTLDGHRYVFLVRTDLTLWCEEVRPSHPGASPAAVDGNVVAFQPVDAPASAGANALVDVLGTDGKLWEEIVKLPA